MNVYAGPSWDRVRLSEQTPTPARRNADFRPETGRQSDSAAPRPARRSVPLPEIRRAVVPCSQRSPYGTQRVAVRRDVYGYVTTGRPAMRHVSEFLERAFLPEGDLDLPARFYQGLCLVGGILAALVVLPVNALQNLPVIISIAVALLRPAGVRAVRRGAARPLLLHAAVRPACSRRSTYGWFPNAGVAGSIGFYFFAALPLSGGVLREAAAMGARCCSSSRTTWRSAVARLPLPGPRDAVSQRARPRRSTWRAASSSAASRAS